MLALRLEDPAPPSVDPLIPAGARALAEEFESHAASLGATFSRFEQACLDIGTGLGEAVPDLADLATMFRLAFRRARKRGHREGLCGFSDDVG